MRNFDKLQPPLASSSSPLDNRMMTVADIAKYLRIHRSTIYRLLKLQAIPGFKIGSDWRFKVEEIDAWRLGLRGQVERPVKRLR